MMKEKCENDLCLKFFYIPKQMMKYNFNFSVSFNYPTFLIHSDVEKIKTLTIKLIKSIIS